jgi:hypothetical protein
MPFVTLSQAYNVAPSRRDAARTSSPLQALAIDPDARPRQRYQPDSAPRERDGEGAREHDCDSARRSPLLRALLRAIEAEAPAQGTLDLALERTLIAFARALNQASSDGDAAPQPAAVRADEAARRRAAHEAALLDAFAALQHAAGRPRAASPAELQSQLGAFLHQLARQLDIDDDRAGEATQPGSLISVHA